MAYRLRISPSADRMLARLHHAAAAAVVEFVTGPLLEHPHRVGKPLLNEFVGCRSARRGPYRVIYRIIEEANTVDVLRIDHRADVYRTR